MRLKRDAYVTLFGLPGQASPQAQTVLDDLDDFCTTWRESVHMDSTGRMDPYTTIYRDGKKAVAIRIRKMIEWSEDANSSGNPDQRFTVPDPAAAR